MVKVEWMLDRYEPCVIIEDNYCLEDVCITVVPLMVNSVHIFSVNKLISSGPILTMNVPLTCIKCYNLI